MAKGIVMLHGANAGGWCFERFRTVFESLGWTCHMPDLIGHGDDAAANQAKIAGVGMADYRVQLRSFLTSFAVPPVILGHSMGAVLAQQLAAKRLAQALILVSPAPRAGILPVTRFAGEPIGDGLPGRWTRQARADREAIFAAQP